MYTEKKMTYWTISVSLHMAFSGSAAAHTLSWIYICAFLFVYIWWKKLHVSTWGGEIFKMHALSVLALKSSI